MYISEKYLIEKSLTNRFKDFISNAETAPKNLNKTTAKLGKELSKFSRRTKILTALGGVALALGIIKDVNNLYRSKIHQNCSKFNGDQLRMCKIKTAEYMINELNKNLSKCNQSAEPDKCRKRIQQTIIKYKKIAKENI